KEIFTYSALGLSPPDVGALFFAESSVYAIVGGVGGYLLSQGCAALLSLGGEYGLFHPPEMNFSSFASAMTILVVMATVMLSTIYPALQAGKSANPGVTRSWRMPAPEGETINFVFPFTVSEKDMTGILSFIGEHFGNHADSSLGSFAATRTSIFKGVDGEPDSLGIRSRIALAPFDLGVSQDFTLRSQPSEIPGIDEVVVRLDRISGTEGAWLRGNRDFITDLRNQFLFWRNLPVETVEHYRAESARLMQEEKGDA
ncbi:MAG: FtsX-like permease family protein, partial [Planctomycetota bacterium]